MSLSVRRAALVLIAFTCFAVGGGEKATYLRAGVMVRLHGASGQYLGPQWARVAASAVLAAYHVNNRISSLVPAAETFLPENFHLEFELADTRSDATTGTGIALDWFETNTDVIIGGFRSLVAQPVTLVADIGYIPVVSWGATSTGLSDSIAFRGHSRTIPSDAVSARGAVEICLTLGWGKIALLYVDDSYGR